MGLRGGRMFATAALIGLALAGCSSAAPTAKSGPVDAAESTPTSDLAPFALDADFPDPDILMQGGTAYAYATNAPGHNIQLATSMSADLSAWQLQASDPLPQLPGWAIPGKTWAPDVSQLPDGTFVMYFTAANTNPSVQCIGVATSTSASGPFAPQGAAPLVCPSADGGAIDPSTFVDAGGMRYLLFKNDGNCCGLDTYLQIVALSPDGLSLAGEPRRLVKQDQPWEGNLVEAPILIAHDGRYVLFYSANDYGSDAYAVGFATADAPLGPYTKNPSGPLLSTTGTGGRYLGPGGQDVVTVADGTSRIVFHSWDDLYLERGMNVLPLTWSGGVPSVG